MPKETTKNFIINQNNNAPSSNHCDDVINYVPDQQNLTHNSEIVVNLNFHFVLRTDRTGNFNEPGENPPGFLDGVQAGLNLLQFCNSRLANIEEYNQTKPAFWI